MSKWAMLINLVLMYFESIQPFVGPILYFLHSIIVTVYLFCWYEYFLVSYLIYYYHINFAEPAKESDLSAENILIYPYRRMQLHIIFSLITTATSCIPIINVFVNLLLIFGDFVNIVLL